LLFSTNCDVPMSIDDPLNKNASILGYSPLGSGFLLKSIQS
jgi:hypothetical protein